MPAQNVDQQDWEDSVVRSNAIRFTEFISSGPMLKKGAWIIIGSIFIAMSVTHMQTKYNVPTDLLGMLFLGQALCLIGFQQLKQESWPPKRHIIHKSDVK
ncbi:hypothetical protein ACFFQF_30520 [Haladaptatus pallidirubidus]|nr:hypothetical protein [Haladaptatus pallidirubidus]